MTGKSGENENIAFPCDKGQEQDDAPGSSGLSMLNPRISPGAHPSAPLLGQSLACKTYSVEGQGSK